MRDGGGSRRLGPRRRGSSQGKAAPGMRLIAAAMLAGAVLTSGACRSSEWKRSLVHARFPVFIYIEHREKDGQPMPLGYAQPADVPPEEISFVLRSLTYNAWGLFKGSRVEPVFSAGDVEALAPRLSDALSKVGSDERVRFLFSRKVDGAFRSTPAGVSAVVFLPTKERLDLAFDLLNESLPDDADPRAMAFRKDPTAITGRREEIIPPAWASIRRAESGNEVYPRWVEVDREKARTALASAPAPAH